MTFTKGNSFHPPSKIPGAILRELTKAPTTVDGLMCSLPYCRRSIIGHLNDLRESGRVERVAVLANLQKPLYRRKVR
jgi:DNA-binding HxlR family transcriptional regulator